MAKKKLLNETQVRRFMGLAGLQALAEKKHKHDDKEEKKEEEVSEGMYGKKMEEDEMSEAMYAEQEPAADDEMDMGDEEGDEAEDTKEISKDMVDDAAEALSKLDQLINALGGEGDAEADVEPEMDDMDMGDDAGADDLDMGDEDEEAGDEEVIAEALKGVNLQLSEKEVVQEVARRVAKRILKAKQAQARLDEALGNRKTRRTRRPRRK